MNNAAAKKVYKALQLIPKGKVTTYKLLAEFTGLKNPRLVGNILHKNTNGMQFPCHRVVRSDGTIALGYAMGGPIAQRKKLEMEDVQFSGNKVDFHQCLFTFQLQRNC